MTLRPRFDLLLGLICGAVVVLIVYPLAGTLVRLFTADESFGAAVSAVLERPTLPRVLLDTALVIGASTALAVAVASLFAWLNERTDARMGWLTDILPVVSLLLPSIAGAIGWVLLASPQAGFINVALRDTGLPVLSIFSWPGLIFVYTLYMIPQVYLTVAAALRNVDPALEEAARVSGSGRWRTLRTVTLPVVRPAMLSGALLALVYGLALFSVPLIIGTQARIDVLTVEIVRLLTVSFPPRLQEAVVLSLIVVVVIAIVWSVNARSVRRGAFATIGGRAASGHQVRLAGPARIVARAVLLLYLLVACVLPLAALALVSLQGFWSGRFAVAMDLQNYEEVFAAGTETFEALRNSVLLGVGCAFIGMALAVLIAYRIGRGGRFGKVLDATTKLPGTMSHVVVAIAFVAALAGPPFGLEGTILMLLLAYLVLYLTQATVSAQATYAMVGKDLSEASRVAGAGPGATLRRIALPLMAPGLAAGWAFVFVLVVGDITASAILASPSSPVIGFEILSIFQNGTYPVLAALATVISVVSAVIVLSALAFAGRRRHGLARRG